MSLNSKRAILPLFLSFGFLSFISFSYNYAYSMDEQTEKAIKVIQSAENLTKSAISDYKSGLTEAFTLSTEMAQEIKTCNSEIKKKTLSCENRSSSSDSCKSSELELLKGEILACMRKHLFFKLKIYNIEKVFSRLEEKMTSGSYDNLINFKNKMLNKLNIVRQNKNKMLLFSENLAEEFSQQYTAVIRAEFAQASSLGTLSGRIKGTCINLKNGIDFYEATFKMRENMSKSYFFWASISNTLRGFYLVSNALKETCPSEHKPANYGPLLEEVNAYIKTLSIKSTFASSCARSDIGNYLFNECKIATKEELILGPYLTSVLSKLEEVAK